ncbi:MAG: DUF86 domain-containing protein [Promicromonosporaceae bacterium]|nr:DUF86 domain-containing protein [Promicromonosporaceae bacterium]
MTATPTQSNRPFDPDRTRQRLADIIKQASLIETLVERGYDNFTALDFDGEITRNAAIKGIEIIAEATAKLHPTYRDRFPQVPWREIYRMRTKTTHHYDQTNFDEVWDTMVESIPALLADLGLSTQHGEAILLPPGL